VFVLEVLAHFQLYVRNDQTSTFGLILLSDAPLETQQQGLSNGTLLAKIGPELVIYSDHCAREEKNKECVVLCSPFVVHLEGTKG
jgi:hypothetical protein